MTDSPGAPSLEDLLERRSRRLRILVLQIAIGCSLGLAIYALTRFLPPRPYGLADDYRVFFAAARLLGAGHDPYWLHALQALEQQVARYPKLEPTLDRFAYLPVAAALLEPLSKLPFWASYVVFTCFGAAAALLTLALLARDLGWTRLVALVLGVLVSWVALLGFSAGQFDALLFAVLAGAMLLAWHDRPLLAGLVLGLIWVKPDLLWPAPIFLFLALWERPRRALWFSLGFVIVSGLCLAASASLLQEWWRAAHAFAAGVGTQQPDLAGLPGLLGAAPKSLGLGTGLLAPGTMVVIAAALIGMVVFAAWMMLSSDWRRVSPVGRIAWGVGLPVGIWLLATPYAHPNDDLLLVPLFMLTVGRDARRVHGLGLGLALLAMVWLLLIWPSEVIPWVLGLLVLAGLGAGLWRWRTDPHFTGFGAGLCVLALALLPPVWAFHLLHVGLTPIAVLVLVVEGARTCWMEVGGAGSGPAYVTEVRATPGVAPAVAGG
ncbi:MAG: glycosyltransferase family 87 protein [Candidatus Dormibacteria bacterium]